MACSFCDLMQYFVLLCFVIYVTYTDIKTRKIPNIVIISLLVIWIILYLIKYIFVMNYFIDADVNINEDFLYHVFSSLVILVILLFCLFVVKRFNNKNNDIKKEYFGMGDVKLLMVIALYLGIWYTLIVVFISSILFIFVYIVLRILSSKKINSLPYAPFLLCSIIIVYFMILSNI